MNYYETLEITKEATDGDIKKAYRSLSLKHHPDRPNGNAEKFKEISQAYETLSDTHKKQQYDYETSVGGGVGGGMEMGGGGEPDIQNVFNHFFQQGGFPLGGGGGGIHIFRHGSMDGGGGVGGSGSAFFQHPFFAQFMKPTSLQFVLPPITLEQAYQGCMIFVPIERTIVKNDVKTTEHEELQIALPEGIEHNETIVVPEKGNCLNGTKGDVKVIVQIAEHPHYTRQGLDVHYIKHICLKEALCGLKFDVPLLNDKTLTIKFRSKIIKPNHKQVCSHFGMKRNEQVGNMIIEFVVDFPDTLTERQQEQIAAILDEPPQQQVV